MTDYMSDQKRFCSVYKSSRKAEMYIYVDRKQELKELPEGLLTVFGEPQHVLDLILTPSKKLARVTADRVLADIAEKGFFLQMPPAENEAAVSDLSPPPDSLHG